MKSASQAVVKWQNRASGAGADYTEGAQTTDKDQAARAIAAKQIYQQALTESFGRDAYARGLAKSGKAGWIKGVIEKGAANFQTGVTSPGAQTKYASESGRYDSARKASDAMPRGSKGSAQNLAKVTAVVNALRAVKVA